MKRKFMTMGLVVMALMLMALSVGAASSVELISADFGADVIGAGNFKPSLTLQNNGEAITDATLITVVYEGKRLKDISYEGDVAIANGSVTVDATKEVSVTDAENSEIKVMLWKDYEPLITAQTLNDKSRSLDVNLLFGESACMVNTGKNIIYVPTSDGNAAEGTLTKTMQSPASVTPITVAESGKISTGDTYMVSAANETVPTKVLTVLTEGKVNRDYITTFDSGMGDFLPNIDAATDDAGNVFANWFSDEERARWSMSIIQEGTNNVWKIDRTMTSEQSLHKRGKTYGEIVDRREDSYKIKFVDLQTNRNLARIYCCNRQIDLMITTDSSKLKAGYDVCADFGTNIGVNNNTLAQFKMGKWYTVKIVSRKTETGANYQLYLTGEDGIEKYCGELDYTGHALGLSSDNNSFSWTYNPFSVANIRNMQFYIDDMRFAYHKVG